MIESRIKDEYLSKTLSKDRIVILEQSEKPFLDVSIAEDLFELPLSEKEKKLLLKNSTSEDAQELEDFYIKQIFSSNQNIIPTAIKYWGERTEHLRVEEILILFESKVSHQVLFSLIETFDFFYSKKLFTKIASKIYEKNYSENLLILWATQCLKHDFYDQRLGKEIKKIPLTENNFLIPCQWFFKYESLYFKSLVKIGTSFLINYNSESMKFSQHMKKEISNSNPKLNHRSKSINPSWVGKVFFQKAYGKKPRKNLESDLRWEFITSFYTSPITSNIKKIEELLKHEEGILKLCVIKATAKIVDKTNSKELLKAFENIEDETIKSLINEAIA